MSQEYDVIIAGGGHNGLACGAYLAKAGKKVIVLEARDLVGGGVMTEELTLPGFKHNTHSYMHTYIFRGPIYDELELEKHGSSYIFPDEIYAAILPDHSSLIIYRDMEKTCKQIEKFSPRDAKSYKEFCQKFHKFRDVLMSYFFSPPAKPSALSSILETTEEGMELLQMQMSTQEHILDEYLVNP